MSSFLKNLIIICYEGRVTVHVRKTMQERTLLNIAILTGLQTCGILCHTQSVGHLVLKFLRGVLNPDQKSVICHLSSYFICIGNPIYYRIFMSTYLIFFYITLVLYTSLLQCNYIYQLVGWTILYGVSDPFIDRLPLAFLLINTFAHSCIFAEIVINYS